MSIWHHKYSGILFSLRVLFLFPIIIHILEGHKLTYHTTIETKVTFYPDTEITNKKLYLPFFSNYNIKCAFTSELIAEWNAHYIRWLIVAMSTILYEMNYTNLLSTSYTKISIELICNTYYFENISILHTRH